MGLGVPVHDPSRMFQASLQIHPPFGKQGVLVVQKRRCHGKANGTRSGVAQGAQTRCAKENCDKKASDELQHSVIPLPIGDIGQMMGLAGYRQVTPDWRSDACAVKYKKNHGEP